MLLVFINAEALSRAFSLLAFEVNMDLIISWPFKMRKSASKIILTFFHTYCWFPMYCYLNSFTVATTFAAVKSVLKSLLEKL